MGRPSFYAGHFPGAAPQPDAGGAETRPPLRFLTCGSVDDGKSTLIGRLLYDTGRIYEDQLAALARDSRRFGTTGDEIDLALLTDGLEDERSQGITIDVAYRFFATARRAFVVADAPGHEQYTRNMATAASTADLAVILVDARKGVLAQTRRHAFICAMMGIREVVLAVNKIDLVGYEEAAFRAIVAAFGEVADHLQLAVTAIPISARLGDNVCARSAAMPWHDGPALLAHLEEIEVAAASREGGFRFPVQWVNRADEAFRGYCGTARAGRVVLGDTLVSGRTGLPATVARIIGAEGDLSSAEAGEALTLTFTEERDFGRGDLLSAKDDPATVADQFAARLVWLSEAPLLAGREYLMKIGTQTVPAAVTAIRHTLDVTHFSRLAADEVRCNEIAVCNIATSLPVAFDAYARNRETGSFILIDRYSLATVGAGMIEFPLRRAANLHPQKLTVDRQARAALLHQTPAVLWFTGLSGSGKSTIADIVERRLHAEGRATYMLDGDNMRHGISRDLGFTDADRVENIRRAGEMARILADAGLIVLCSFISPFRRERRMVRDHLAPVPFVEVFVDTPLEICQARDPKGLYAKALRGEIKNFTGIDSPYEVPEAAELHLRTASLSAEDVAELVMQDLRARALLS